MTTAKTQKKLTVEYEMNDKKFSLMMAVATAILAIAAFSPSGTTESLRVRKIELVDRFGKVRGVITADGITLRDAADFTTVALSPAKGMAITDQQRATYLDRLGLVMTHATDTTVELTGMDWGVLELSNSESQSLIRMDGGVLEWVAPTLLIKGPDGGDLVRLPPEQPSN